MKKAKVKFNATPHRSAARVAMDRKRLNIIYSQLPETTGCMDNISKEGGCNAWCCRVQSPHLLEVEFANTMLWAQEKLCREELVALFARALRNYLSNDSSKPCIFFDYDNNQCLQHETRPFACRTYGIMPEEEWKPRYELLRVLNQDVRPQCDLVKTVDGKPFTKEMSDDLWNKVIEIEKSSGVAEYQINDKEGGTYLTYHDHFVLAIYNNKKILSELTKIKTSATQEEKEKFIAVVCKNLFVKLEQDDEKKEAKDTEPKSDNPESGTAQ